MPNETEGAEKGQSNEGLFTVTRWSVVLQAREKSETALSTLCESYRQPLLVLARSELAKFGQPQHLAEDQVQGFLLHLLTRNFLENVGPEKGRFRTFLRRCFQHYLRDLADKLKAAKRGGGQAVASLDETNEDHEKIHDPAGSDAGPDKEFDRVWARTLLKNAFQHLEQMCARQGHEKLYTELQPVMFADETAASYRAIGEKVGMTEAAVKVAAHRMRTRLRELIREEVTQTITNNEDLEDELRYLMQLFGR